MCVSVHVCEREKTGEGEKERESAKEKKSELHGNSCSNTKWSLLEHYPSFVVFPSISLPPHNLFISFIGGGCVLSTNTLDAGYNFSEWLSALVENIASDVDVH